MTLRVVQGSSVLAREIWQAGVRNISLDSVWSGFSKKVITQTPFLTPRDVSVILLSFARIRYRDEQMMSHLVPSIIKHMNEFSVREIVSLLSAMKKLEFSRLDCVHLFVNQLSLRKKEWNAMDCALIANCLSWFRVFDEPIWKIIQHHTRKNWRELEPIGISLLVGALARLDLRDELMLDLLTRALTSKEKNSENSFTQETFAVLINGFSKLRWDKMGLFENYLIPQLEQIIHQNLFDQQSVVMLLHALSCYRFEHPLPKNVIQALLSALRKETWSSDQAAKLRTVLAVLPLDEFDTKHLVVDSLSSFDTNNVMIDSSSSSHTKHIVVEPKKQRIKLPRWEYEVFRILKDSVKAQIFRKNINGKTHVLIRSAMDPKAMSCLLCLGPYQYYASSTKRTAASLLNEHLTKKNYERILTVPYFVWNELKTDQDKVMYLLSLGRNVTKQF